MSAQPKPGEIWRHVEQDRLYKISGCAVIRTSVPALDMALAVIFHSADDGIAFVQPMTEFQAGRYERKS